jgi:predicted site-specific integrase-resolvase
MADAESRNPAAEQMATGTVIIKQPSSKTEMVGAGAALYARVSSADQKNDRDRLMRFGFEYVELALTAQNRKVIAEVEKRIRKAATD